MMNLFKYRISILSVLSILLLLAACGQAEPTPVPEEPTTAPALQPVEEEEPAEEEAPTAEPTAAREEPEAEPEEPQETEETTENYPAPAEVVTAEDDSYPAPAVAADTNESYPDPAEDSATEASTRTYTVNTDQSSASYIVAETFLENAQAQLGIDAGLVDTIGTTEEVSGQMTLAFDDSVELISGTFEVNIQALTSDQQRRDNTIQERFLESAAFPIATFEATAIENFPEPYREGSDVTFDLVGNLTIRETTLPVTFETTANLSGDIITAGAVANLVMSDFGVTPPAFGGLFSVEDEFQVTLIIVMTEQQ